MMRFERLLFGAAMAIAAAAHATDAPTLLLPTMKEVIAPQAQVLWDLGNKAYDDDGNIDAKRLSATDWASLADAAQTIRDASLRLAGAPKVTVAPAGVKLQDEGAPGVATAVQVQANIDSNPKGFAGHARDLAGVADTFLAAAKGRDAAKLMDASNGLDAVCEACHVQYWYPDQPK